MKQFNKWVFRISLALIPLLIIIFMIGPFVPLEFTSYEDKDLYQSIVSIVLFLSILFTLFGTLKKVDSAGVIVGKVFATIFVSFISLAICVASTFNFCAWSDDKVLFENKKDRSKKILLREFGCGAVDSGSPSYAIVEMNYYTRHIVWVKKIDTASIDKNVWIRVPENKQ